MVGYYTGAAYSDTETKADNAAAVTIAIAKNIVPMEWMFLKPY